MLFTSLRPPEDEDDILKRWMKDTCCGAPPPTRVDGVRYLLVGEEASQYGEIKWWKSC
jgi:hypothetical protein